jgi:uncharacterized protein YdcH (DUF465 family)
MTKSKNERRIIMGYLEEKSKLKQRIKETEKQLNELHELEMWMEYKSDIPFYLLSENAEYMRIMEEQKKLNNEISGYKKTLSDLEEKRKAEHTYDPYVTTDLVDIKMTITILGYINGHMI